MACVSGMGPERESDGTGGSCQVARGAGKGLVLYSNQMRRLKRVLNREVMRSVTLKMNESRDLSPGVGKESRRLCTVQVEVTAACRGGRQRRWRQVVLGCVFKAEFIGFAESVDVGREQKGKFVILNLGWMVGVIFTGRGADLEAGAGIKSFALASLILKCL